MKSSLISRRLFMLQDEHQSPPELSPNITVRRERLQREMMGSSNESPTKARKLSAFLQSCMKERHELAEVGHNDPSPTKAKEHIASSQLSKRKSHKQEKVGYIHETPTKARMLGASSQSSKEKSHKRAKAGYSNDTPTKVGELSASLQSSEENRSFAMKQAENVQAELSARYPSFIKLMLKSHVSGGFWLGLPSKFCDDHLPLYDTTMILVDETGKESHSKYLAVKRGLSGGWRGFSIDHGLLEGDALVFHLIASDKFKIYIIRAQDTGTIKGALRHLTLDYGVEEGNTDSTQEVQVEDTHTLVDNPTQSSSEAELRYNGQKDYCTQIVSRVKDIHTSIEKLPQSSNDPESISGTLDVNPFSDSINFERLESFEKFSITFNSFMLDSKFSDYTRKKYYDLCSSQKCFLHEHLLKGLNSDIVVGTISEIVNISDAISSFKTGSSTSCDDLQIWEKTLEGFELLGMKVGFMRARVRELMGLASEHLAEGLNRLKEILIERALLVEEMKGLEEKLTELKERMEKYNLQMEAEITKANAWIKRAK